MGAHSDSISEQFAPNERYKAQQREMAETLRAGGLDPSKFDSLATYEAPSLVPRAKLPPHLIEYQAAMCCSICKMPFPSDVTPSQGVAFAKHVAKVHRPVVR